MKASPERGASAPDRREGRDDAERGSKSLTNHFLGMAGRPGIGDLERFGVPDGPLAGL